MIRQHQNAHFPDSERETNRFPRPNKFFVLIRNPFRFRRNLNSSLSGVECQNSSGAKHRFGSATKLTLDHAFTALTEGVDSPPATSFLPGSSAAPFPGPLRTRKVDATCLACGVLRKSWKSRSFEKT